jgi:hypothetical protein
MTWARPTPRHERKRPIPGPWEGYGPEPDRFRAAAGRGAPSASERAFLMGERPAERHTAGVHSIYGLEPADAVLRFRALLGEVVVEITNGTVGTTAAGYLTGAEARRLAADLERGLAAGERIIYGRDADGCVLDGPWLEIRRDGMTRDRVILEPGSKRAERVPGILTLLADGGPD